MARGTLNIHCTVCGESLHWHKQHVVRDDGYYDWRIVVSCGCGEIEDPQLLRLGRDEYDQFAYAELETERQNTLDAVLGKSGNLYFETLVRRAQEPA